MNGSVEKIAKNKQSRPSLRRPPSFSSASDLQPRRLERNRRQQVSSGYITKRLTTIRFTRNRFMNFIMWTPEFSNLVSFRSFRQCFAKIEIYKSFLAYDRLLKKCMKILLVRMPRQIFWLRHCLPSLDANSHLYTFNASRIGCRPREAFKEVIFGD